MDAPTGWVSDSSKEVHAMTHGLTDAEWASPVNYERLGRERLGKARAAMAEHQLEALVCFTGENIRYLTGILPMPVPKPRQYCIVTAKEGPIFFAQGGDIGRLKENAPHLDIRIAIPLHLASKPEILSWASGLKKIFSDMGVKTPKIGFDQMSFTLLDALKQAGVESQDGAGTMASARMIKTPDEIELIRNSVALADVAWMEARRVIRPGARECDIQAAMAKALIERGAEMIRGVCTARSYPYWRTFTAERQVRPGDIVIIDRVHIYKGYACDHVRSFVCGRASAGQKKIYQECKARLQGAIEQVRPGNTTADVQSGLRDPEDYSETGLSFMHGIGLDVHEPPFASASSPKNPSVLKPNMTLAIETYAHDDSYGVRLEHNLLVTNDGYEILSTYPLGEDFE
jgi:Xaa-Pro aminopeptidase